MYTIDYLIDLSQGMATFSIGFYPIHKYTVYSVP